MSIDGKLYQIPIAGPILKRTHSYFREHITVTDIVHVLIGFGIGLVIAGGGLTPYGVLAIILGATYHLYALLMGQSDNTK